MMNDRLKEIYKDSGWTLSRISERTGIPVPRLRNAIHGHSRINSDIIEAVACLWPQYVYWLVTGKTLPESGQISPEDERLRLAREALDRDVRKRSKKE